MPNTPFFLIAGPCVVESEDICLEVAETVSAHCRQLNIPYFFKASFKKANRSKLDSYTGPGKHEGLEVIQRVGRAVNAPTLTDIHESSDAAEAAAYVDALQIPAFLCRQTDLLLAAGETGKIVNIKKGQFLAPAAMQFAVDKVKSTGNNQVWLTERGTTFGYTDLVVDFRGIPIMAQTGCPVVMDITHSLQQPNQGNGVTGGLPRFIAQMARCAVVSGAQGIFLETHPDPSKALSDGANMLPLTQVGHLLEELVALKNALQ